MLKYLAITVFALTIHTYSASAAATGTPIVVPIAVPSNLVATVVSSSTNDVILNWTDNASDETAFNIFMATSTSTATPASSAFKYVGYTLANRNIFTYVGIVPGVQYYFEVDTVRGTATSKFSNIVRASLSIVNPVPPVTTQATSTLPTAPSNLFAVPFAASSSQPAGVHIAWNDNSNNESAFTIDQVIYAASSTIATYSRLAAVAANATSYVFASGTPGKVYTIVLSAVNAAGYSNYTPAVTFTFPR